MRLIDANALKLSHCKECALYPDKCMGKDCDLGAIIHINEMPTIDIEPQWIPCSERMPNDDKDYLVTDGESMAVGYYRTDAKAWDNVNFGWLEHREETCGLKMVIAWMPLPEPYGADMREES